MKVRSAFTFDETELRTIRAAIGRGGRATRKECQVFIDRAVRSAIEQAPTPKPARAKAPKPQAATVPADTCTCTEEALCDHCRGRRARIRKMYRTASTVQEAGL